MPLKGQAKKDYQRRYMRQRRGELKLNSRFVRPNVRPNLGTDVNPLPLYNTPELDADGNLIPNYD